MRTVELLTGTSSCSVIGLFCSASADVSGNDHPEGSGIGGPMYLTGGQACVDGPTATFSRSVARTRCVSYGRSDLAELISVLVGPELS